MHELFRSVPTPEATVPESVKINTRAINQVMQAHEALFSSSNTAGSYNGSTVVYRSINRPCLVCKGRGKRRSYEELANGKFVKAGRIKCDACGGKGWSTVTETEMTYLPSWNPVPYTVPTPYVPSPTTSPPFYGTTTVAPNIGSPNVMY